MNEYCYSSLDEQFVKKLLQLVATKSAKGFEIGDLRNKCAGFALKFDNILAHCTSTKKVKILTVDKGGVTKMMVTLNKESKNGDS